jgi:hypothetical protein
MFSRATGCYLPRPVQLANGYLLKRMCWDAVTSVTYDDFINSPHSYTSAE